MAEGQRPRRLLTQKELQEIIDNLSDEDYNDGDILDSDDNLSESDRCSTSSEVSDIIQQDEPNDIHLSLDEQLTGKDGTVWSTIPPPSSRSRACNIIKGPVNKVILPPGKIVEDPVDAFFLFLNDDIISKIVNFTNLEAQRNVATNPTIRWKPCDSIEIYAYLGLLLTAGHLKQNNTNLEVLGSPTYGPPIFRATMSLHRFKSLTRVTAALVFFDLVMGQSVHHQTRIIMKPGKYPLQVHNMYEGLKKAQPKTVGVWSAWSPWTLCSRSCGGGIMQQTRRCINRPADPRFVRRQRRRRQANGCVGLYKRIHLCNNQECPSGRDFRYEQCAAFNNKLFKGRNYFWEPFLNMADECALNCRPLGMNFYATLNKTVIDGTPCKHPVTSTGRSAPSGTRGVCIDGHCKSVNANGIIGSVDDNPEECNACLQGTCRSINGLYTKPDLPPGYSLVAQIPKGACRILIQQLKHTRNFIALRNSNGSFIINGDWKIGSSGVVYGAGTKFNYIKQDGTILETISSPGPLSNAIDIMIISYQNNPGIKYGYALPIDPSKPSKPPQIAPPLVKRPYETNFVEPRLLETPSNNINQKDEARPNNNNNNHRRTRVRRRFAWKISGVSACSKSCGGGVQATVVTCVREHTQTPVLDRRCAHIEKPMTQPIRCNMNDCPPEWVSHWTSCSATCGAGLQHLMTECQQELSTGRRVVINESICPGSKRAPQTRPCNKAPCENTSDNELTLSHKPSPSPRSSHNNEWTVGPWSPCSVSCGTGHRTRSVICPSGVCKPEDRPKHAEYCDSGFCRSASSDEANPWLLSDWTHCSESCGTGTQDRLAICFHNNCTHYPKPETSRACSSDKECGGHWFTGPWGPCTDSCTGHAKQKREVLCVVKIRGQNHITNEMTCPISLRPHQEQPCEGACPPHWFMGEWSNCEGCPNGVQRREVRCMTAQGRPTNQCGHEMPLAKRECTCYETRPDRFKPIQDEPVDRSCVDKIRNCYLAVQARLCQYPYYMNNCCVSCKRAQQDLLE